MTHHAKTILAAAFAANMFIVAGTQAQMDRPGQNQPVQPGQEQPRLPSTTPGNPGDMNRPGDKPLDAAERERLEKEWIRVKAEWEALTPEQRTLSVLRCMNTKAIELGRLGQERASSSAVREFAATMAKDHTENNQRLATLVSSENITLWDNGRTEQALKLKKMFGKNKDKEKDVDQRYPGGDRPGTDRPGMDRPNNDRPGTDRPVPGGHPSDRTRPGYDGEHNKDHAIKMWQDPIVKLRTLNGEQFDRAFASTVHAGHTELLSMLEKSGSEINNANIKAYTTETTSALRQHHAEASKLPGATDKHGDKDRNDRDRDMKDRDNRRSDPNTPTQPGTQPGQREPGTNPGTTPRR